MQLRSRLNVTHTTHAPHSKNTTTATHATHAGQIVPYAVILGAVRCILADTRDWPRYCVSMVTHGDRDYDSPRARELLQKCSSRNRAHLALIDSSLFVIGLDDKPMHTDSVKATLDMNFKTPGNRLNHFHQCWALNNIYSHV